MAKVNAPLFSFNASGKLAKSLVYFGWKGLDVVRSYVVPTNPKSDAQEDQRDYLRKAVAKIHVAQARDAGPLVAADNIAYAAYGSTFPTPMTWFNAIAKNWILVKVAGKSPVVISGGSAMRTAHDDADMSGFLNMETDGDLGQFDIMIHLGTSKTNLVKTKQAQVNDSDSFHNVAAKFDDLIEGTKYYWQARVKAGAVCEGVRSGIYSFVAT